MLLHIGFGAFVPQEQVIAILPYTSSPLLRLGREGVRVTRGRSTKSQVVMSDGSIFLSAITTEALAARWRTKIAL